MTDLQIELTRLIGRKEVNEATHGLENFPATLSDLHRWIVTKNDFYFEQSVSGMRIEFYNRYDKQKIRIKYDSSLDLLDQSESALKAIINLIKEHEKDSMEANR